ncbi:MAG: DUF883 family protein [Verrucomicrobiales bacterium]|nr:DUF883 family protein [Verrucomicrobiales bacterium]
MTASTMTKEAADRLLADLRAVVRDGQDLLKAGAGDLSEKGKEARARLEEALQRARVTCEQAESKAGEAAHAAESAIREHPFTSVGVAFGIGVLLGALIQRR